MLPRGIIPVIQTPFHPDGRLDETSLSRLVDDAIAGGAAGFLAPVVASEVAWLSVSERKQIVRLLSTFIAGRVPWIVGASSDDANICQEMAALAEEVGAVAWLAAVPSSCYQRPETALPFFREITQHSKLPLVIQDLQFHGSGMPLEILKTLQQELPLLQGLKIETVPAGPKYSAVREVFGEKFFIAGGWAVPQMIEALDRGVDAMIPESSMVRVYREVFQYYCNGQRDAAVQLFRQLLPVLSFANQELATSVAFFKRLLVRKKIFAHEAMRLPGFTWDAYNRRIADELIELYLQLETQCVNRE